MKDLDKILEAFNLNVLQSVSQVKRKLDQNDITWDEFRQWLNDKIERDHNLEKQIATESPPFQLRRLCPDCNSLLMIGQVNHHPAFMVGGDYKCQWFCRACGFTEYSNQSIDVEVKPYIIEVSNNVNS